MKKREFRWTEKRKMIKEFIQQTNRMRKRIEMIMESRKQNGKV